MFRTNRGKLSCKIHSNEGSTACMAGAIICVDIVQRSDCWKTLLACNRLKTMKKRKSASKNMVNINILIYIYTVYCFYIWLFQSYYDLCFRAMQIWCSHVLESHSARTTNFLISHWIDGGQCFRTVTDCKVKNRILHYSAKTHWAGHFFRGFLLLALQATFLVGRGAWHGCFLSLFWRALRASWISAASSHAVNHSLFRKENQVGCWTTIVEKREKYKGANLRTK